MKLLCIIAKGFEEVEAIGTVALLRRSGITVDIATISEHQTTGKYDVTVTNLLNIEDTNVKDYDGLLLPGGPHYAILEKNEQVRKIITSFFELDKYVFAICAAPTILGRMGYLKNKNYTCFTSMNEDFGGTYSDKHATIDGKLITGKSAASIFDFAFLIVETLQGEKQLQHLKEDIYY